jgi:tetratricopeptide (TPR) repeat protein
MPKGDEKLWAILNDKLETLRATNSLEEAIRVGESALELAKRTFSAPRIELALSYEKVGLLHDQKGDHDTAKPYLVNAYKLFDAVQPPDRHALFRSARRLARICDELNEREDAILFYEKAIAVANQISDLPYTELGTLLNNAALSFRKAGRGQAAEPYYLHALRIYENHLGPEHADVASVLNNIGVFYTNEKRFSEAEKAHLRALAIREKTLPPTHADIAQSKCNLAVVYHSRGDYQRASELYRASLKTWEEATAKPPKEYEVVASNYADLLRSLGEARKAQALEQRARKKRRS